MIRLQSIFIYLRALLTFFIIGPILLLISIIYTKFLYLIVIPWCKFMIWVFGCKINVKGEIPDGESFVIMANHQSFLDVFAVPVALKGKFSAVAAAKNFTIPIYRTFLKKLHVVSIDRSNLENSIKGIQQAEKVLKSGYHIVILPEGTRTLTGELNSFKKGGFHLAINTKARIIPVITKGLFNIKPKNRWYIKPGEIKITVGKPISSDKKNVDELLKETYAAFNNHLES